MLVDVNERFQLPIAYHFIISLIGRERAELFRKVAQAISQAGVTIVSFSFDGLSANDTMCEYLCADFKFDSEHFKPHILASNIWKSEFEMRLLIRKF